MRTPPSFGMLLLVTALLCNMILAIPRPTPTSVQWMDDRNVSVHGAAAPPSVEWNATWGGSGDAFGYGVALDAAGNLYCGGTNYSIGALRSDIAVVKWYPNGTRAWTATWGNSNYDYDYGEGVALDAAGNLYCGGSTDSFGPRFDFVVVKWYPNGTQAWNATWGGSDDDYGEGVALDAAGNLYCGGSTGSFGASWDFAVVKWYPNGTRAWNVTWGGSDHDFGQGVAVDAAGNLYCGGFTDGFGTEYFDFAVVKFNSLVININTPNGQGYHSAPSMDVDFAGTAALEAGYYKLDSYAPSGNSTTGWLQIFTHQAGNSYTTDFMMNSTMWESLSEGDHVLYFKAWDAEGNLNDGASPSWQFYKDTTPPTYTSVLESADPLELGGMETITITGVVDRAGIQSVLLTLGGSNHTMTNLTGSTWRYDTWTPNSTGMWSYSIYLQDKLGNWNAVSGAIQVVDNTPPSDTSNLILIIIGIVTVLAIIGISAGVYKKYRGQQQPKQSEIVTPSVAKDIPSRVPETPLAAKPVPRGVPEKLSLEAATKNIEEIKSLRDKVWIYQCGICICLVVGTLCTAVPGGAILAIIFLAIFILVLGYWIRTLQRLQQLAPICISCGRKASYRLDKNTYFCKSCNYIMERITIVPNEQVGGVKIVGGP